MAIGAFPAAKLGILAIKQISKPIANIIKSKAKSSPVFKKYVCMPPAQLYNWIEVKTKMRGLNLGKARVVPPLSEDMAIELGASLLGEFIIFTIGAALLVFEYSRQVIKENRKQEALEAEKTQILNDIADAKVQIKQLETQVARMVADQESRSLFRWVRDATQLIEPKSWNDNRNSTQARSFYGDYDPDSCIAFDALNYLQTRVFDDGSYKRQRALQPINDLSAQLQAAFIEATQVQLNSTLAVERSHLLIKSK